MALVLWWTGFFYFLYVGEMELYHLGGQNWWERGGSRHFGEVALALTLHFPED